jgi:hypothetical protein
MTEEQNATQEKRAGGEILEELESLGAQLVTAIKALWDSEDSRKLRQEIGEGFVELGRQVDEGIKSAQESEAAQEFKAQVKETVDKARQSDVAGKLEDNLVSGLRQLNAELGKLVSSMESKGEPAAESEPTTGDDTAA